MRVVNDINAPSQHSTDGGVTANEIDPGHGDWPVEEAQSYMRSALLNDQEVIRHLLALADLREQWRSLPNWMAYQRALNLSPLCDLFTVDYLDRRISVIRQRLDCGMWGQAIPVDNKGAGYGRQRGAHPSMAPETIELAVADLVQEGLGGSQHPNLAPDKIVRNKVRQYRRRLRLLASS